MKSKERQDLFENAIDSLKVGIKFYIYREIDTAFKHAILNIFHCIELLLKEKLFREHPLFIYKNINVKIDDNSQTVGLDEIFIRFKNLDFQFDREHQNILKDLQKRRNQIEHHKFKSDDSHFFIIGKSLRFLYEFMPEHLNTSIEEHLDTDLYQKLREIILEYDERLKEAEDEVRLRTTPRSKDDLCDPTYSGFCPECGNLTVVIGTENGDFCFFCQKKVKVAMCESCGEYFPIDEIDDLGLCRNCFDYKFDRF